MTTEAQERPTYTCECAKPADWFLIPYDASNDVRRATCSEHLDRDLKTFMGNLKGMSMKVLRVS